MKSKSMSGFSYNEFPESVNGRRKIIGMNFR